MILDNGFEIKLDFEEKRKENVRLDLTWNFTLE